jgi:enoyl-CoA hydratase
MFERQLQDGVAVVTLTHGKVNALDLELCRGIRGILREAAEDGTRAVVLTGRGTIFSAGVDLKRLLAEPPSYVEEFFPALCDLFEEAFFCPKPLVAALNGHAVAGGCVLACAADYRVVGRGDFRLGVPELLVGVPFPHVALEILRSCLEPARFRSLLFRGFLVGPETGLADGLVDEVVDPPEVLPNAMRVARELAGLSGDTFHLSKMQIRAPARARLASLTDEERGAVLAAWTAPETREAVRAFVERSFR